MKTEKKVLARITLKSSLLAASGKGTLPHVEVQYFHKNVDYLTFQNFSKFRCFCVSKVLTDILKCLRSVSDHYFDLKK